MGGRRTPSFWHSRSRASSAPPTPRPRPPPSDPDVDPPIGCMSMVHHLIFAPGAGCVGRPPAAASSTASGILTPRNNFEAAKSSSGFEAPRNSLDLDADSSANHIQVGVQIEPVFDALARTGGYMRSHSHKAKTTAPSSEAETPRTPSLVARLMGIDGLPDQQQPSPSPVQQQQHHHHHHRKKPSSKKLDDKENTKDKEKKKRVIPESMNREPLRTLSCNSRSLPDTPRASTSARASWDGPRLSLQALKESVLDRAAQYMSMPSSPTSASAAASAGKKKNKDGARARRRRGDEKENAREILRQARETVASRKQSKAAAADKENVSPIRPAARAMVLDEDKPVLLVVQAGAGSRPPAAADHAPCHSHSHSPRAPLAPRQQAPPQRAKPSRPPPPPPPLDPPTRARRPDGCERFATRIKKPAAGGAGPPPPPGSGSGSGSNSTPEWCSVGGAVVRVRAPSPAVPLEEDPEYRYLRTVLERGGFMRPPPKQKQQGQGGRQRYSVDPIVFHLLELELPAEEEARLLGPLRHRWNRKLLFQLAQEVLAELLLLPGGPQDGDGSMPTTGLPLLRKVWGKVRGFPAADCRVVGDIDALVARDLEASPRARRLAAHPAVAEEAGDVAEEVAERVLEALVGECVAESVSLSFLRSCSCRRSSS